MAIDAHILSEWDFSEWSSLGSIVGTLLIATIAVITLIKTLAIGRKSVVKTEERKS